VRLYGQIQIDYSIKERSIELQERELTVEDFLKLVNEKYLPGILRKMVEGGYIILRNGSAVRDLREKLNDGDIIAILPTAVGGCKAIQEFCSELKTLLNY
jgi:molybdopterin converting factor small subunit